MTASWKWNGAVAPQRVHEPEVEVPAYAACGTRNKWVARMLDILLHGVSTRNYKAVIPEMAETGGVEIGGEPAVGPGFQRPRWKRCSTGVSTT